MRGLGLVVRNFNSLLSPVIDVTRWLYRLSLGSKTFLEINFGSSDVKHYNVYPFVSPTLLLKNVIIFFHKLELETQLLSATQFRKITKDEASKRS